MKWHDISKRKPIDTQRILVYHPCMADWLEDFLDEGIWPISHWNEKENMCEDADGKLFEISHWTPFVLPSEIIIESFKKKE